MSSEKPNVGEVTLINVTDGIMNMVKVGYSVIVASGLTPDIAKVIIRKAVEDGLSDGR